MMYARSKLIPKLNGHIVKWFDADQFVVSVKGREIIGHKDYWEVEKND